MRCAGSASFVAALLVSLACAAPSQAKFWTQLHGDQAVFLTPIVEPRVLAYDIGAREYTEIGDPSELDISQGFVATESDGVFFKAGADAPPNPLATVDLATGAHTEVFIPHPAAGTSSERIRLWNSSGSEVALAAGSIGCSVECTTFGSVYLLNPTTGAVSRVGLSEDDQFSHPLPDSPDRVYKGVCAEQADVNDDWALWAEQSFGGSCPNFEPHELHGVFARDRQSGELLHVASSFPQVFPGEDMQVFQAHLDGGRAVMLVQPRGEAEKALLIVNLATGNRQLIRPNPAPFRTEDASGGRVLYTVALGGADGELRLYDLASDSNKLLLGPGLRSWSNLELDGDQLLYIDNDAPGGERVYLRNVVTDTRRQLYPALADADGDGVPDSDDECPHQAAPYDNGCPVMPVQSYVALGDSVAAGEGIEYGFRWEAGGSGSGRWLQDGSDNPVWFGQFPNCHQSESAYPFVVEAALDANLTHLACTGSSAYDGVLRPRSGTDMPPDPQLGDSGAPSPAYDAAAPEIVTLTLGANDVQFKDVVMDCYTQPVDCNPDTAYDFAFQKLGLRAVLQEITDRGRAAGTVPLVLATTYYDPFPPIYPEQSRDCVDLSPFSLDEDPTTISLISSAEMDRLRAALRTLNANIGEVAADFRNVVVVKAPSTFDAHKWCSPLPWTYGPSTYYSLWGNPAPFHPTEVGQAAFGAAIVAAARHTKLAPPGRNVSVPLGSGANVTFQRLEESVVVALANEGPGLTLPPPDNHLKLQGFEIVAAAPYEGEIRLSIPSPEPASLYHYDEGEWQQVPDSAYDGENVTGTVTSLSPFALGTPAPKVQAAFTQSGPAEAPAAKSFNASASSVADGGEIADYAWDFGDGTTATGVSPSHTYTRSGSYEVELTVTSEEGAVSTATGTVAVTNSPPTAVLTAPNHAEPGETVSLSGVSSSDPNGFVAEWVWDLGGDSGEATGSTVERTFEEPGEHQVSVTVLDDEGASDTATATIEVSDTVAPETQMTGPAGLIRDPTPTFSMSSSEAGASFECRIDSALESAFAECDSPFTTAPLSQGRHVIETRAVDEAGNSDESPAIREVIVDSVAPQTTITKGPRKRGKKRRVRFVFISSEAGSSFDCKLDARTFSGCVSGKRYRVKPGRHKFTVIATDKAGNPDPTPATRRFRVRR